METNDNSENGMDVKELLYGDWNAVQFFEDAMQCNLLAVKNGFIFVSIQQPQRVGRVYGRTQLYSSHRTTAIRLCSSQQEGWIG